MEQNRKLRVDPQRAEKEIKTKEGEMGSLNQQLYALEKRYDNSVAASREKKELRELKKESKKAAEVTKERDEEIVSL